MACFVVLCMGYLGKYEMILEGTFLKNKRIAAVCAALLSAFLLTACTEDSELSAFRTEIDDFCTSISEMDTAINNIDATSEDAVEELLGYLDDLDAEFKDFAALDFPEEFDYLESVADEASEYMSEAAESYRSAYAGDGYSEATADYAKENLSRAYKRVQIIITFLHGEQPEDVQITTDEETVSSIE